MCIPIGLEFRCKCDWTGWQPCNDPSCDIQSLFANGGPPMASHGKLEAAGVKMSRATPYIRWAHETLTFIKFDSCCGSGCCNDALAHYAKEGLQAYRDAVKTHLEGCIHMFLYGPVLLNSMRSIQMEFADIIVDRKKLAASRADFTNAFALLETYEKAVDKGELSRKLNLDRVERTPLLQYLYFRRAALERPDRLHGKWKPSKELLTLFGAAKGRLGQPVMADAQAGFELIDTKKIDGHLRQIAASQKAATAYDSPEEDHTDEMTARPLPISGFTNPGAAQNLTCEDATERYIKLFTWVNEMHDLSADFDDRHEKTEAVKYRKSNLLKAQDRMNSIQRRTRNEDDATYLHRSSVEAVIQAKFNNLKSISRGVKIPAPSNSTRAMIPGAGQGADEFSRQYAPTIAPVPALIGDYPPQTPWDAVQGFAAAPAAPAGPPTQFRWLSKAEAEAQYSQVLHELRGLGRLNLTFLTPQQQLQAIEKRKRDLLSMEDRSMRTFTAVDREDQYTRAIREQVEGTIQNLRNDVKANEERLLAAVPAAAPPGPAYGQGRGAPPAPMYPP